MRRGRTARNARRVAAGLGAAAFVVAACTGSSDEPVATVATTTTEPRRPRVDDRTLTIGALIPVNDPTVGPNLAASFERAVGAINDAGGVLGRDVELIIEDEGDSATTAAAATQALVEEGVDAIVGPTSSNVAIAALDAAVAAGVVTCSATATAISLDEFPDDGLFFRSIATDSLQAEAIASQAELRGAGTVVIVHVDDAYGQPYASAVDDALDETSIRVTTVAVPFADDDLQDDLDEVAAVGADTAIILGNGDDIALLLEAISTRGDMDFNQVIVNDAARALSSQPVIAGLDPTFRSRVVGLAPQIVLPDSVDSDDDTPFASQVIDCVTLIALAAAQGDSDAPATIASQMTSVSSGGDECRTYAACVALLEDDEIDYDGPTRITDLARDGDPSRAFFDRFSFGTDGSSEYDGSVAVG